MKCGNTSTRVLLPLAIVFSAAGLAPTNLQPAPAVQLVRLPAGAIQPQLAEDSKGGWHLIYFKGDAASGNIFYSRVTSRDELTPPVRVNDRPGAGLATGNVRGAHLAVGRGDRVHVAWVASTAVRPADAADRPMMLYTRAVSEANAAFEPARNVAEFSVGLDGGDLAADADGHVIVAWHAGAPGAAAAGEGGRHLFVARSSDDGRTFAQEAAADDGTMGACGCCGTRALSAGADVFVLFRSATDVVHRDTFLLASHDHGRTFASRRLDEWRIGACPMSTFALAPDGDGVLTAWENDAHVRWSRIDRATGRPSAPVSAPAGSAGQKHPVIRANARGDVALVWTEGMAWNKGGDLVWQLYDRAGAPTAERGRASGVPPWSLIAVKPNGRSGFTIFY